MFGNICLLACFPLNLRYMAPEMVIMLSQASYEKTGYSAAVDWWSLGVTMFKLLTGYRPFTDDNFNTFVEMATTMNERVREHCDSPEYAILFQEIPFPSYMSADAKSLISRLLDVNDKTRLGAGPNGAKDVKSHVFFKNIDWELLEQKHVEPPYKPQQARILDDLLPYADFDTMLKEYGKYDWIADVPSKREQAYFSHWLVFQLSVTIWVHRSCLYLRDFVSPHTLRVEAGLSHVMDQYDKNFKVRQLMGTDAAQIGKSNATSMKKSLSKKTLANKK